MLYVNELIIYYLLVKEITMILYFYFLPHAQHRDLDVLFFQHIDQ